MKKRTRMRSLSGLLGALLFWGVGQAQSMPEVVGAEVGRTPPVVGNDRDVHGCIASAGYAWCPRESACVRWWELAAARGLPNEPDAARAYCAVSER